MELLKKMYEIHSPSGKEDAMISFVTDWVKANVDNVEVSVRNRNIYVTKGVSETYPCVVAHTDQVQDEYGDDYTTYIHGDTIFAFSEIHGQEGLGADDKNGIWVALKLLVKYDVCKAVFFHSEEIGCGGSMLADMDFFNDCRFVIQCDRKGASDFITIACGVQLCSEKFIKDCEIDKYEYSEMHGSVTDVMQLKENGLQVCACNISCGYHNPHTNYEVTKFSELVNCLHLCENIFNKCTDVYPHTYEDTFTNCKSYGYFGNNRGYYSFSNFSTGENPEIEEIADCIYDELLYFGKDDFLTEDETVALYKKAGYKPKNIRKAYKLVMGL